MVYNAQQRCGQVSGWKMILSYPRTDTVELEDVRKTKWGVLMWRSANTFTSGTVNSLAGFSGTLMRVASFCEHS